MKLFIIIYIAMVFILSSCQNPNNHSWIRINQLGYLPISVKVAVLGSKEDIKCSEFSVIDYESDSLVFTSKNITSHGSFGPFKNTFRLNFSQLQKPGKYYIQAASVVSLPFKIDFDVYDGAADFLLQYMRQQRCGFNPFLKDSCHTQDGYTIYGPMPDSTHIDVTGGWHDASDYLQYVTTSANATFHLLFAYRENPTSFSDNYSANGLEGSNGIPDVLDEARWGLEWLLKMHPRKDWMFNQIADDRDHLGFRLPTQDTVSYGKGKERPVYFCSGEPQGLLKYRNRSTGTSSTAAKFVSAFALGAQIFKDLDTEFSEVLKDKAQTAYAFAKKKQGVCQTAPCRAPYFYEEDNWVDDLELASVELYHLLGDKQYYQESLRHADQEPVTPWMGADTARHYQWYPFLNLGHYEIARSLSNKQSEKVVGYYHSGIMRIVDRAQNNAFQIGIPFIWCSNNLVSALCTQIQLYHQLTNQHTFDELQASMCDWLFGSNPWGVSMIIGLPADGTTARDPHSAFTFHHDFPIDGGLLDGPVYGSIYRNLKYVHLKEPDEYAEFQSDLVVYHDDVGDYATNEPTMDGTASLVYFLVAMENEGRLQKNSKNSKFKANTVEY